MEALAVCMTSQGVSRWVTWLRWCPPRGSSIRLLRGGEDLVTHPIGGVYTAVSQQERSVPPPSPTSHSVFPQHFIDTHKNSWIFILALSYNPVLCYLYLVTCQPDSCVPLTHPALAWEHFLTFWPRGAPAHLAFPIAAPESATPPRTPGSFTGKRK